MFIYQSSDLDSRLSKKHCCHCSHLILSVQ